MLFLIVHLNILSFGNNCFWNEHPRKLSLGNAAVLRHLYAAIRKEKKINSFTVEKIRLKKNEAEALPSYRGEYLKAKWRPKEGREKVRPNKSEGTKGEGRIEFADEGAKRKAPLYESIFLSCHADNICPAILEKCTCLPRDEKFCDCRRIDHE